MNDIESEISVFSCKLAMYFWLFSVLLDWALLAPNFNPVLVLTITVKLISGFPHPCFTHSLAQVLFEISFLNVRKTPVGFYCVGRSHGSIIIKCLYCLSALFALGTCVFYGFTTYKVCNCVFLGFCKKNLAR